MRKALLGPAIGTVLLVLLCLLASCPWGDTPVLDDFSYAWMVKSLLETGRIVFTGWNEPYLGLQAFWGALIAWIFGWSFESVRLSTIPFGLGCAALMYATGRLINLSPPAAAFGAFALCLSPLAIPLEVSFQTEIPSLFFTIAALYCATRAVIAIDTRWALCSLALALISTVAALSIRQSSIVLLPVVSVGPFLLRRDFRFRASAFAMVMCTGIPCALLIRWFSAQQYTHSIPLGHYLVLFFENPKTTALHALILIVTLLCFSLPAMLWCIKPSQEAPRLALVGLCVVGVGLGLGYLLSHSLLIVPFGNVISDLGVLTRGSFLGSLPAILRPKPVFVLVVLSLFCPAFLFSAAVCDDFRESPLVPRFFKIAKVAAERHQPTGDLWFLFQLAFSLLYLSGVVLRTSASPPYDRYILPVLPLPILLALRVARSSRGRIWNYLPWCALAGYALFGIAGTHDFFSQQMAVTRMADELVASGISRRHITAGFDYDAVTQLNATGRLQLGCAEDRELYRRVNWFLACTPSISPRYQVRLNDSKEGLRLKLKPQRVQLWLPPRQVEATVALVPSNLPTSRQE